MKGWKIERLDLSSNMSYTDAKERRIQWNFERRKEIANQKKDNYEQEEIDDAIKLKPL